MSQPSSIEAFAASIANTLVQRGDTYGDAASFFRTADAIRLALESQLPEGASIPEGLRSAMDLVIVKLVRLNHQLRIRNPEDTLDSSTEDTLRDLCGYVFLIWSILSGKPLIDSDEANKLMEFLRAVDPDPDTQYTEDGHDIINLNHE